MSKDNQLVVNATTTPRDRPDAGPGADPCLTDHAFSMRWARKRGWQRLVIADRDELPRVRHTSSALQQGQVVVDGMNAHRMADGVVAVYRPDSHVKRLNNGARRMALPLVDFDRVWGAIRRLVDLDQDWVGGDAGSTLHLRMTLAGNGSGLTVGPAEECLFTVLAAAAPPPEPRPATLMVLDGYVRAWPGGTGDVPVPGNAGIALVPGEIATNYGYDQILWLDATDRRFVTQAGGGNVFVVVDGVLTTPPLDATVLPGVTRDSVVKLARDSGTRVDERAVELAEVLKGIEDGRVTELFTTSTASGIVPVSAIWHEGRSHELSQGAGGPVTTQFRELLDGVHRGERDDRFGWMRRLTEVAAVQK